MRQSTNPFGESDGTMNFDKAKDVAEQATEKASELAEQLREKAGPAAEKAGELAAKGVEAAADAANKVTGGRFEDQINPAAEKVTGLLRKDESAE